MRALPFVAAALAGCASVPSGPPPPPPEAAFADVKAVALVHRVEWRGAGPAPGEVRRPDPLDGLQAALAERGLKTVTVELGPRPEPDLAEVASLARWVEWEAQDGAAPGGGPSVATVGGRALPVLARLGADALALYARGPGWVRPPPAPMFGQPMMAPPPAPVASLSLVARDGTIVTYSWGGGVEPFEAGGPMNAAEAIEAVLSLLAPAAAE